MTKAEALEMIGKGFLALAEVEKGAIPAVKEEKVEPVKEEKKYTMEEVRKVLSAKSSAGFTAEVKAILEKHGGAKLSKIDPSEYAAILAEVEEVG